MAEKNRGRNEDRKNKKEKGMIRRRPRQSRPATEQRQLQKDRDAVIAELTNGQEQAYFQAHAAAVSHRRNKPSPTSH